MFVLDVLAVEADRVLFLSGPPPEPGTVLEMRSDTACEVVLVEHQAGSRSVQVMRAYRGRAEKWPPGTCL
ncbi:MAG TPA: hypothetical protein VNO31_02920, partial [Umezawaea sp.]|nr:hypothetical protein [Umezawaea sp.]